jgi:hypothetical protein
MPNYSDNPGHVRVDFYKPSGKWYMTEQLTMGDGYNGPIFDALEAALVRTFGEKRAERLRAQYIIVVQEPYHANAFPLMLLPEWLRLVVLATEQERDKAAAADRAKRLAEGDLAV